MIIAGERSGVGKTTITLAILAYLTDRGDRVQSFKIGPDYIDPMFHTRFTGRPCRNLDPVLTSEAYVKACFAHHSQGVDRCLIEGVMGLFDGIPFSDARFPDYASTAHIARLLQRPVLLVIDGSRLSSSVAAIARGYQTLDPTLHLAGVILNRVGSDRHLELLKNALESIDMPILGVFRRQDSLTIPDRHLGLVPTEELPDLDRLRDDLIPLAREGFNWDLLLPLLSPSRELVMRNWKPKEKIFPPLRIGIAQDKAFNFYYRDNFDILEALGAELVFWSPLTARNLPDNLHGLYFGGGFPEVFARELGENRALLGAIGMAIRAGLPTYAECGGLMYLCEKIIDFEGIATPMVGIVPQNAVMAQKLTLGYRQGTALEETILLEKGQKGQGHEFHRSSLTGETRSPVYQLTGFPPTQPVPEGWRGFRVHASYLHLHFGSDRAIAEKFLRYCLAFSRKSALTS
jgi:cobyrinic acid a,c-diamide synthase